MCVLVPCHDLLTHAAGLILNHHLVLMWSVGGGDGSLAWEVAVGCSYCRWESSCVCKIMMLFSLSVLAVLARCLPVGPEKCTRTNTKLRD